VEYSFELIRRLQQPGAVVGGVAHWSSTTATSAANFNGAVLQVGNTLSGFTVATNTITFPANQAGSYYISMMIAGATSASAIDINTVTGGVSDAPSLFTQSAVRDAVFQVGSLAGTTTFPAMFNATLTVTAVGGTAVLSPSTIVGAGSMDLFIFSLPSTIVTVQQELGFQSEELAQMKKDMQEMREWIRQSKWDASVQPAGVCLEDGRRLKRQRCDDSDTSESDEETVKLSQSMIGRLDAVVQAFKTK